MQTVTVEQALAMALQEHQAGRLDQAEAIYRQILQANPDLPAALHFLGVLVHQQGQHQLAIELIDRAVALNPTAADYHSNRGTVLRAMRRMDEAIESFRTALRLKPDFADAHFNLASANLAQGDWDQAIAGFRMVLQLQPNSARAYTQLADALFASGQSSKAVQAYGKAVQLQPDFSDAHNNLGYALQRIGLLDQAMESYKTALKLRPNWAGVLYNMGNVFRDQARLDEALECYRQAMSADPGDPIPHSNLVYSLYFHEGYSTQAVYEELLRWREKHAGKFRQFIKPCSNDRDANRVLRIGYVSHYFRDHCLSFFTIPLFSHHDRSAFEVICYSDVLKPDEISERIRNHASEWRDVAGMPDDEVADLIRADRIDMLVDLNMHMAGGRLLVFARKPAPVQVTWLAYPGSTGLETVDYRISDPHLDPPGVHDPFYSEQTMRLADSFWCYDPLSDEPDVNPLPAKDAGHVTFGCVNNFVKVNDHILDLWRRVLEAAPGSRLLILSDEGSHRQRTLDRLAVDPRRVEFLAKRPRRQYLELFHRIDIALDTFPYNGHTTSLDALWMGVPVITRLGETAASRAGLGILTNLGLTEFIAGDETEYVQLARKWASEISQLSELRATLRNRMKHSPLMDGRKFARGMESIYRTIWRQWCNS